MSDKKRVPRRRFLGAAGSLVVVGVGVAGCTDTDSPDEGSVAEAQEEPGGTPRDDDQEEPGGTPRDDDQEEPESTPRDDDPETDSETDSETDDESERELVWMGHGAEHARQNCLEGEVAVWEWVLTPGGSTPIASDPPPELTVSFADGSFETVEGFFPGGESGAVHFEVFKQGGGKATSVTGGYGMPTTTVTFVGGGENAQLVLSDGECLEATFWQVDFGEGEIKDPPTYWPDDVMAALGNSVTGVTDNPSLRRQNVDGQLGDVEIDDRAFTADDPEDPTELTVRFEIDDDGESRELHLSAFALPGPFDEDETDDQEFFEGTTATFEGGDTGELTVSVPQGN